MHREQEPTHKRQNTCPVMVLDADIYPREKTPHGCSEELLKTLDTESLTSSEDDYSLSWRMSDCSLENSKCSCSPSYDDVYVSLSSTFVAPINLDVFLQVLLHEKLPNKFNNRNLKLCREVAMSSSSFCIAVLYTVAGVLFTIGAIDAGFTHDSVQNMFLSGSCLYFCGGSIGLSKQWKAEGRVRTLFSQCSQRCSIHLSISRNNDSVDISLTIWR